MCESNSRKSGERERKCRACGEVDLALRPMSSVFMSVEANSTPVPGEAETRRRADASATLQRLALALALPAGLAIAWELVVRAGWSDGRLMPPPSRIWQEFEELARNGEL